MLSNNFRYVYQILAAKQDRFCLMFPKYYTQILYSNIIVGANIYITIKEELSKNYHESCVQRIWNKNKNGTWAMTATKNAVLIEL